MSNADILLTPGEKGVFSQQFSPNLVLFWLKTNIVVTNRRIAVKAPNTILGIIPLGYQENSMPIGSVAGVNASIKVQAGRFITFLLLGLMLLVFGFLAMGSNGAAGFFLILLAIMLLAIAANAIRGALGVTNNGGAVNEVLVSCLEQSKLNEFKNHLNEYVYTASSAGTSWNDAYASNSQGFQNQMGYLQNGPTAGQQFNPGAVGNGGYQGQPQPQQNWNQGPQQAQPQQNWGQGPQQAQPQQNWNQGPQQAQPQQSWDQGNQQLPQQSWNQDPQQAQPQHNWEQDDNQQPPQQG
ncbi:MULTISPECIES: hypothetical protein [unclassified Corynebacterium]|uniref:hypothetical protein n=1 Tax=unclassified Corynebacterium TaxID=2624378 RepID=UPI00178838E4|nr:MULTISPECIES: hypothetical protein [unclassified Corynebacterium]